MAGPMPPKICLPRLIGHRGVARYAPENTLEGLHAAADMGMKWVEFDVKLTRDGVPILFHDDTLDRTTNGTGSVAQRTLEDLRQLEAGSWFADSFSGIKIPTLEDAVSVLLERNLGCNLEIKPCPGREVETAEATLDLLSRLWDWGEGLLISSFSYASLEAAHDMAPEWARGLLLETEWPPHWSELADYLEVASVNVDGHAVTREQVEKIVDQGYAVLAYTVNEHDLARRLFSWGVDGLFTDAPDLVDNAIPSVH